MPALALRVPTQQEAEDESKRKAAAYEEEVTEKEKFLSRAERLGGKFDLQGLVGQWWARAKTAGKNLQEAYQAVGKSYAAQRAFRAQWVSAQLKVEQQKRMRTQSMDTCASTDARYFAAGRIYVEEGSDDPALEATCNYIQEAIRRAQAGETLNGHPYVLFNSWTKRYEFLYTKLGYNEAFRTSNSVLTVENCLLKDKPVGGPSV